MLKSSLKHPSHSASITIAITIIDIHTTTTNSMQEHYCPTKKNSHCMTL